MASIISLDRTYYLIKKTWRDYQCQNFVAVVLVIALFGCDTFFWFTDKNKALIMRSMIFPLAVILGEAMFASTAFKTYTNKQTLIISISIPATKFEKILALWLYSLVVYQLIILMSILILRTILAEYSGQSATREIEAILINYKSIVPLVLLSHSISFLGAISFRRNVLFKTALITVIIFIVITTVNSAAIELISGKTIVFALPFSDIETVNGSKHGYASLGSHTHFWISAIALFLSFSLWLTTYYRFGELEVC